MFRKFLVVFISLVFSVCKTDFAQSTDNFKEDFTDAEYYLLMGDYNEALPLYTKLLKIDSANANLNYRIGVCYINIPGLKDKSVPYLQKAVEGISGKYVEGSYKERSAPPEALFYLGQAYMLQDKLDDALKCFNEFKERLDVKDIFNLDYVNQEILACKNAKNAMAHPVNLKSEKIDVFRDAKKNCNYPIFSGNREVMVFSVKEKFYTAIYYCTKSDSSGWSVPANISLDLGLEGEIYPTWLNKDGTYMLIFQNEVTTGNIYYSKFSDGKWEKAKKYSKDINSHDWETFASVSSDGNAVYFTSTRKGGYGGLDIYMLQKLPNGKWDKPKNIGETINTPYNEESPILSPDGNTLYFASQGHNSIGGFDIFYSRRLPDNRWTTPINLGYPINTTDDEYFYFPYDSTTGVMPLAISGESKVYDLYQISVIPSPPARYINLNGQILLSDNADLSAEKFSVVIKSDSMLGAIDTIVPNGDGYFSYSINPGNYSISVISDNYTMDTMDIFVPKNYNNDSYPVELKLNSKVVAAGNVLKLQNILFDFDSYELSREAKFELEKIFKLMVDNPSVYIEITGHTDSKGSPMYNLKLSSKRANAVAEYLINKGIDEKRFVVRGMGSLISFASNTNPDGSDNPEGRHYNRRVNIKLFNADKSVKVEFVDVPEHLRPTNLNYTILLAKPGEDISKQQVKKVEKLLNKSVQESEIGPYRFIYIGEFSTKSDAIESFNKVIDLDIPGANLINEEELQRLIRASRYLITTPQTIWTVLVATSEIPLTPDFFKGLLVTEQKGDDNLYRYYFGAFKDKDVAQEHLEKVNSLGFPNAILVKLKR
ncbi:MAG: OmpA family protein [Bacteroidales bacterium]|nr:OmpA family protein [Bacteroidales bacterium]